MFLVQSRNKNFGSKMPFHLPGAYYIFQLGCLCFSSRKMRPRQPKEASTSSQAYKDKLGEHFLQKKNCLGLKNTTTAGCLFFFPFLLCFACLSFTSVYSRVFYASSVVTPFFGLLGCACPVLLWIFWLCCLLLTSVFCVALVGGCSSWRPRLHLVISKGQGLVTASPN